MAKHPERSENLGWINYLKLLSLKYVICVGKGGDGASLIVAAGTFDLRASGWRPSREPPSSSSAAWVTLGKLLDYLAIPADLCLAACPENAP